MDQHDLLRHDTIRAERHYLCVSNIDRKRSIIACAALVTTYTAQHWQTQRHQIMLTFDIQQDSSDARIFHVQLHSSEEAWRTINYRRLRSGQLFATDIHEEMRLLDL